MEHYYFHLRPLRLTRPPRRRPRPPLPPTALLQFRLQVEGEQPIDSGLCFQADFVKDELKCNDCFLDFRIEGEQAKQGPLISLKVLLRTGEESVEMGSCQLDGGIYVDTFNSERKVIFQQNMEVGSELSLDYEVYIAKSRFALEKLIGATRGTQNSQLQSAFKKRAGQRKVRCVEFDKSRERSVQEEEFQRAHRQPVSSLKRSGSKYSIAHSRPLDDPQRPASPTSPTFAFPTQPTHDTHPISDTHPTHDAPSSPPTPTHDIPAVSSIGSPPPSPTLNKPSFQQQPSQIQNASLLKTMSRAPQNSISYLQANTSWVQGNSYETTVPKMANRQAPFNRSMVIPHIDHELSMIENNRSWDVMLDRAILIAFSAISLLLLYFAMTPSRKI